MEDGDPTDVSMMTRQPVPISWEALRTPSLRNSLLAAVLGLLLAGCAGGLTLGQSGQYYSQATLLIDNPLAITTAHDDTPILKLNALRIKYASPANPPALLVPAPQ